MKSREKLILSIKSQLAIAKEINSDFVTLTTNEAKAILKLLERSDTNERVDKCVALTDEKVILCKTSN